MRIAYRPDVDGLRAIAVLSVLGFHAFPAVFPGGFIGVDVFFVISGFLITSILYAEMVEGDWSLAGFYARRILRIFPALLLVLTACLFVGWHVLLAHEYKQLGKHIAAGAAFVSNFALWFEAGYFDKVSDAKPLLHLWSLGIEEQFYILWPLLLWGVWRFGRQVRGVTAIVFIVSLSLACTLVFTDRTQAFYSPLSRAWELLAGALLALQLKRGGGVSAWCQSSRMQWSALGLLIASIFLLRPEYPFPGALALLPVGAAVVLIAAKPQGGAAAVFLSSRFMVAIGLISYPLYLWHWPLLSFAHIVEGGQPPALVRLGLLLASFVLAALTYWLVEKPMRRLPRRWAVGGLVMGIVLVGLLGKNVHDREGLERIRHKRIIGLNAQAHQDFDDFEKTGLITDKKCASPFRFPERDVCLKHREDRPSTAAVIGDSHALHAFWGLAQAFDRTGDNLVLLGRGACVPFFGFETAGAPHICQPHVADILNAVADDANIRNVAIIFRGRYLPNEAHPETVKSFRTGLNQTLKKLVSAGKRVYYFLPVVEPGFDPRLCLGHLPLGRRPPFPCEIQKSEDDKKTVLLRAIIQEAAAMYPQVVIVDPNPAFCRDDGVCPMISQGHSIYKDENHLSHYGSLVLGQLFRPER